MPKDYYSRELPEAMMRPRWCRDSDPEQWWLPWQVHAILETLDGHVAYQSGINLSNNTGVSFGSIYSVLTDLEFNLGLIDAAWEDELFPEAWATKGHTEDCNCDRRRFYSLTPRGRQWLETLPVRPRPPLWKRPLFWVGIVFWVAAFAMVGRAFAGAFL